MFNASSFISGGVEVLVPNREHMNWELTCIKHPLSWPYLSFSMANFWIVFFHHRFPLCCQHRIETWHIDSSAGPDLKLSKVFYSVKKCANY